MLDEKDSKEKEKEKLEKTTAIGKKFLEATDPFTDSCPKCGATSATSEGRSNCNACCEQLITSREKIDGRIELISAEQAERDKLEDPEIRKQQLIEQAAKDHALISTLLQERIKRSR